MLFFKLNDPENALVLGDASTTKFSRASQHRFLEKLADCSIPHTALNQVRTVKVELMRVLTGVSQTLALPHLADTTLWLQLDRVLFKPSRLGADCFGWFEWHSADAAQAARTAIDERTSELQLQGFSSLVHHVETSRKSLADGLDVQVLCKCLPRACTLPVLE